MAKLDHIQVSTLSTYIYNQLSSLPSSLAAEKDIISLGMYYLNNPSKTTYKSQAIKNIISRFLLVTFKNSAAATLHTTLITDFSRAGLKITQSKSTSNFIVI